MMSGCSLSRQSTQKKLTQSSTTSFVSTSSATFTAASGVLAAASTWSTCVPMTKTQPSLGLSTLFGFADLDETYRRIDLSQNRRPSSPCCGSSGAAMFHSTRYTILEPRKITCPEWYSSWPAKSQAVYRNVIVESNSRVHCRTSIPCVRRPWSSCVGRPDVRAFKTRFQSAHCFASLKRSTTNTSGLFASSTRSVLRSPQSLGGAMC
mmetsp:Transcript_9106/g.19633  ORF Transcript_9106/g.19633 Transcript_9106/m.19633 type:complete len:207 (-) Transcript_9106:498-1118(-)